MGFLHSLTAGPLTMGQYNREFERRCVNVAQMSCKGSEALQNARWLSAEGMNTVLRRSSEIGATLRKKFGSR